MPKRGKTYSLTGFSGTQDGDSGAHELPITLVTQFPEGILDREQPRIAEAIKTSFLHLEVLVLPIRSLTWRPIRRDYPSDDGIDAIQKAHAERFFSICQELRNKGREYCGD